MKKEEAIKYLKQLYPNGGHCWLDEQRIEAISMAINALQEEPESKQNLSNVQRTVKNLNEDFENALAEEWKGYNDRGAAKVDALEDNTQELAFAKGFYRGWHYMDDDGLRKAAEGVSEELSNYINELSKQFQEVSFAKLSRIAVRVAKWQKEQDQSTIELAEDHAMLAGMEKMKEEMMAKAIDGKVIANGMGNPILHLWDKGKHLIDKKVKVILIKEN